MRYLPGGAQMKEADQYTIFELGIPSLELMERAAKSCVEIIKNEKLDTTHVLIVCGSGNNGGDGFAIGRLLLNDHVKVSLCFGGNPKHCTEDCRHQWERFEEAGGKVSDRIAEASYSLVVDALFGVGLNREVSGAYGELLERMNEINAVKFAVDIPSGLSADTGNILGNAFRADYTVTFQAEKLGMKLYPGIDYTGKLCVADIGISERKWKEDASVCIGFDKREYRAMLPERKEDSNKGSFGKVLAISGSKGMSGAAYFNAKAALLTGAGLVRIYTPEENRLILQQLLPEAVLTTYETCDEEQLRELFTWADVVCIGSGIGRSTTSGQLLKAVLDHCKKPCVIDADGLNLLAGERELCEKLKAGTYILTPHMKEMSRLTEKAVSEIKKDRVKVLDDYTKKTGAICILKDSRTLIEGKDGYRSLNETGNAAMAKAGSGDVLTGIVTGLLSQGASGEEAAVLGAYIHGRAGDLARDERGSYSVLAEDLMANIGKSMVELTERRD